MPIVTPADQMLLHLSTRRAPHLATVLATLQQGPARNPFPVVDVVRQIISDRFTLAGDHLRVADQLLLQLQFRSSISRHYYAMYHAARAIVFAETGGDNHQQHGDLPHHLPVAMLDRARRKDQLTDARLLRNEADYDPYPAAASEWAADARELHSTAADFVQACADFALLSGHI